MSGDWKQRPEGGGRFAIGLIVAIARRCGRRATRLLLYPITAYFLLVRGPERAASRAYLARALGRPATLADVARHIHTFASTILDRVFLLGGRTDLFDIDVRGAETLLDALARGRGVLLVGSHLGSFDALRVLKRLRGDIALRVVLDRKHNPAISQALDALDPALAAGIIDAGQDGASVALAIKQAVDEGALVAMLADRAQPGEPALWLPFLGKAAPLPTTPWLIAATLGVPVMLAFGVYRGGNRYELSFEPFCDALSLPRERRAERLAEVMRRYAAVLQARALDAPFNWFNFYDYWQDDGSTDAPPVHADADLRRRTAARRSG
ncbi:LpxL/LpxP family acyltransferase [Pseudomonas sp. Hp2]|uniref:LpxL/LpxP family acyltransferase n=1 Tax=Pseudomonas sp. Hp2 TaxID=701189 RepID=UPI0011288C21|nr:acyltransferase [Pseudomonas sp. Hp2]